MRNKQVLKFTIKGDPVTKKNHSHIFKTKGANSRYFIAPSKQYRGYSGEFKAQCIEQKVFNKHLNATYNIKCSYYMHSRRKVDLTNLLSSTMDCLVEAGVIEDDNCKIVVSNDGSRVYYDKDNPRTEIEITEVEPTFIG